MSVRSLPVMVSPLLRGMFSRTSRTDASTGRAWVVVAVAISREPCTSRFSFWTMPPKLTPSDRWGGGWQWELVDDDPHDNE